MLTTMHWLPNLRAAWRTKSGFLAGGRVDRDLVAAGVEQGANVVERANAAADGQRHEDHFGRAADDVEHDLAAFVAGGDVEKHQLVGPFGFVAAATSTGSPASRRLRKFVPLTTRPRSTSRQGMTRLASMDKGQRTVGKTRSQPGRIHFKMAATGGQPGGRRKSDLPALRLNPLGGPSAAEYD